MAATKPRLIIVGLDGATWDAALPYIEAGRLPTLARFMRDGAWGTLNSIHPPETGCCWPTIFTGTNPGKHGVFGFFSLRPGTYERTSTTLADWRMPPLWTLLNHAGMSAGVYNIPVTFPAEAIDGFMVSGEMGAPRVDDRLCASEPARNLIASELTDYEIEPVNGRNRRRDAKRLRRQIEIRNRAAMALARGIPTDALMVTVNYIDHAQHLFWDERLEGTANPVLMAYEGADRLLRSLMDLAGDECDVVVISDHGSGPVEGYLDFDRMLSDLGYLDFIGAQGGKARGGRVPQFLRPLAFRIFSRLPESLRGFARKAHGGRRVDYAATRLYSEIGRAHV